MAEILLVFPPDKSSAARQVEEALAAAGYRAILEPVVEPDGEEIARKASDYPAAMLIWSRPLAASADLGGWPANLRRLPNLIEISTDGIAPQSGDERRVVLLSGWRGQPFHLGWRRVLERLEAIGARRAAPSRTVVAVAARGTAEGAATGRPSAQRRRFALPAAAGLALLGAVGAAGWIGANAGDEPKSAGERLASAAGGTGARPAALPAASAASTPVALQSPSPAPTPATAGSPAIPTEAETESARPKAAGPPPAKRRSAAAPPIKRYSKKHSKTMRLFCARSGRGTPQCRIFARSTGAARP